MYPKKQIQDHQYFRAVPRTGVIYVMSEAAEKGFYYGHPDWANLGQGAPETGPLPNGAPRLASIPVSPAAYEYGPVGGIPELRAAVADLYNARYRRGMGSQYSAENVAISSGGRAGLTRIVAALNAVNLGHFLPDYTAYEELLGLFRNFVPIPILVPATDGFRLSPELLREKIVGMGLGAVLLSNPCNPTGHVLAGDSLATWVEAGRDLQTALVFDEFYSHYLYGEAAEGRVSLSASQYVEDIEKESVIVLDGLTKNWRYPGLRLSWTLGPKKVISHLISAGSFLDGGAPHAIQALACSLLNHDDADREARSVQDHFDGKRRFMLRRLKEIGFEIPTEPQGGFYCFASLAGLPEPLRDGMAFFQQALEHQVISVPGVFFDVNPGKRRRHIPSRLADHVRLSYGPAQPDLEMGLIRLEALVKSY